MPGVSHGSSVSQEAGVSVLLLGVSAGTSVSDNYTAPSTASHILTEAGDTLTTEAGDRLVTE